MTTLLLHLAGPLQSWGVKSRFAVRGTELAPTKSGIIGLLAAALGRRRTDPLEDLLRLRFGVRIDQPGRVIRDFHTAHDRKGQAMPISDRYYLSDAVFLAGIEGDAELLHGLDEAVRNPRFPLYLGRRSCPPSRPISLGPKDGDLHTVLTAEQWRASEWFMKAKKSIVAEILLDKAAVSEEGSVGDVRTTRDVPLSFDPEQRNYGFREVKRLTVLLGAKDADPHDPMAVVEEANDVPLQG
ncbi:type I-E CRISPR-associated protein Cas5/CasD [Buchananella felis]|uniref:type I-E CRISPR-associated protein Cas5/CasD n=1 Tax=Buchananella felis TaxID=3231492 RepID=UPI0035272CC3